ncbi:S-adenosyl-L-methionine-dependent methyltransferase [Biscogniauxia sp. FL1348]|nr:S-adenosyl-L-methionine-dependent methyltransferase [Biscogniauxia sp. FL1348]
MAPNLDDPVVLAETLEALVNNPLASSQVPDDATRRRISEAARKLSFVMEAKGDTVHRIAHSALQLPLARIGIETGLFDVLSGTNKATNAQLAEQTKVDPKLMKRLLRYYQSMGMISQPEDDSYSPNNVTQALSSVGGRSGVSYYFEMVIQTFNALPQFLRGTGYANPTDPANSPWQLGHRTDQSPFAWLQSHPNLMEFFLPWMATQRDGLPTFFDVVDFQQELCQNANESTVLFVDLGGAMGHQCVALKKRHPDLPGRVILQELPSVVEQVKANPLPGFEGIEVQAHDIFTPQPIKGARAYYMRNVLHDFPDHKCVQILRSIQAGMTEESVILIDEMALPERGAPWRATQLDISMMTCLAATERSEVEWRALLDEAGLKIRNIWKYTEQLDDCVIVAIPK